MPAKKGTNTMPPASTDAVLDPAAPINAKPQDAAIGDVKRGIATSVMSEDEKRAQGVDAGSTAGPHDYSPEAQPFGAASAGGSLDTYAGAPTAEHGNGESQPLAVGQAPVVSAVPQRGSRNVGEKLNPDIPNAIHQSPMVRGVDMDPRNDPNHPDHDDADKTHPDFGKAGQNHVGRRTTGPTYADLAADADKEPTAS